MTTELLPCPFCASTVEMKEQNIFVCIGCGANVSLYEPDIIAAWNRRPSVAVSEEMVERIWDKVAATLALPRAEAPVASAPVEPVAWAHRPKGSTGGWLYTQYEPDDETQISGFAIEKRPLYALPRSEPAEWADDVVVWAVERWNAEVKNRPLRNVHRRSLDDTWRQVMRKFGGEPDLLVGPSHDALVTQEGTKP